MNLDYNKFQQSFPLVKLSPKLAGDTPWITKGLKIIIKEKHRIYRSSLRNSDPGVKLKYTHYENLIRTCVTQSESLY